MQFDVNALYSLSVGTGALAGWIRIKKTDPAFVPFIWFLTAGFTAEVASILLIKSGYSNAPVYNIYALVESLLLIQLFYKWGFFTEMRKLPAFLYVLFPIACMIEWIYRNDVTSFSSFFVIGYSIIIVFLAINQLQLVMFTEPFRLYRNSVFLICMGLLVYFTCTILIEAFWFYGLNKSSVFRLRIYEIFSYINLFTNILFLIAVLWIPLKPHYILRCSSVL